MDVEIFPGTYVLAISGGVDSMALLDMLAKQSPVISNLSSVGSSTDNRQQTTHDKIKLIVAHFDHGIRGDSKLDRQLVRDVARQHKLPFVYHEGQLGAGTSEATARKARYEFLHYVRKASNAQAIITAHHQDDVLETVILNILRGTGRKGFSSLRSTDLVKRPLLYLSKQQLRQYAHDNQLIWREDSTNQDERYARNYLRHQVIPLLSEPERQQLLKLIEHMHQVNDELDHHLLTHLHIQPSLNTLDRHNFIMLPHTVGLELLATWLRRAGIRDFDRKSLQRLSLAAKTYRPGSRADVNLSYQLEINKDKLALYMRDR